MSGNGSVNAHNNAFGGGRNPSLSGYHGFSPGGSNGAQNGNGPHTGITVCTWLRDDSPCVGGTQHITAKAN